MSGILDKNGQLVPSKLESELQQALEADLRYKQQDNMKKRASRVAKSYEEFRDMVACAHLEHVRWGPVFS